MARRKSNTPTYRLHKPSNTARCWVNGRWVQLGPYDSPESRKEFARILTELAATTAPPATGSQAATLTVDEVLLPYWRHVQEHYRGTDGKPTNEVNEIKRSIAPLRKLYGHTPAAEFGPRALAAVRQEMINAGWCRTLINRRMDRVKRVFKWATSQELVPVSVYQAIRTVPGLQKGRTTVRESEPVKPIDPAIVATTLPHLGSHLRTMVELQLLTGMRPGEACAFKFAEVERTGDVWLYRPTHHKTAHRGHDRVIPIGPKARAVLVSFLQRHGNPPDGFAHVDPSNPNHRDVRLVMADAYQEAGRDRDAELLRDVTKPVVMIAGCVVDPSAPLFSPADSRVEWKKAVRAKRKSKVPPSQMTRAKANPERAPGNLYTVAAYGFAIRKAAKKAGVVQWHPNQLRHTFATEIRKRHGLEAAQVLLGHARADVTQVYSERNLTLAVRVAGEEG